MQHRVLIIHHEVDFDPFADSFFVIKKMVTSRGREAAIFRASSDEADEGIEFIFLPINPDQGQIGRTLSNTFIDFKPTVAFSIGFGLSRAVRDDPILDICSEVLMATPSTDKIKNIKEVRMDKLVAQSIISSKLLSHASSREWRELYAKLGHNDQATGHTSLLLAYCNQTEPFVRRLLTAYKTVEVLDDSRPLLEFLRNFVDHNVYILRAPFQSELDLINLARPYRPKKRPDEHRRKRSFHLLVSYIKSLCQADQKITTEYDPFVRDGTICFEIDHPGKKKKTAELEKIAVNEGKEIWKILRKYLIDGIIGSIRIMTGSVVLEGTFTNRDRALLTEYSRSGVLDIILHNDRWTIKSYSFHHDIARLSLNTCEFISDVGSILPETREDGLKTLERIRTRWGRDPAFGRVAKSIAKNHDLHMHFMRCG